MADILQFFGSAAATAQRREFEPAGSLTRRCAMSRATVAKWRSGQ
jgi:hypothetical protein